MFKELTIGWRARITDHPIGEQSLTDGAKKGGLYEEVFGSFGSLNGSFNAQ